MPSLKFSEHFGEYAAGDAGVASIAHAGDFCAPSSFHSLPLIEVQPKGSKYGSGSGFTPQPAMAVATQPTLAEQLSSVHRSPSSHLSAAPGMHFAVLHVSLVVQALPSVQASPSFKSLYTQPVAASHESTVHGLPSSQPFALPATHLSFAHTSPSVHLLPSSQGALSSATFLQPSVASQLSFVH